MPKTFTSSTKPYVRRGFGLFINKFGKEFFFTYIEDRYRSDPYYLFLNGDIKFEHLRTLSLGPKKRGDNRDPVDKHMEDIGADYGDLYFINDEAVKMRIGRLVDKFNRYISSLATSV